VVVPPGDIHLEASPKAARRRCSPTRRKHGFNQPSSRLLSHPTMRPWMCGPTHLRAGKQRPFGAQAMTRFPAADGCRSLNRAPWDVRQGTHRLGTEVLNQPAGLERDVERCAGFPPGAEVPVSGRDLIRDLRAHSSPPAVHGGR
jgi:hypothetical protein